MSKEVSREPQLKETAETWGRSSQKGESPKFSSSE
jgi:hypothetical protein